VNRWSVFAIALAVRCALAFVFFGSVDLANVMEDARRLFAGARPSDLTLPYLPGVQIFISMAGVLAFHTVFPLAFFFKLPACLFDSAIAAMLCDARDSRAGLLYALAPVPAIIFGIHVQWDSISLAFFLAGMLLLRRESDGVAFSAGALGVLSVIVKPIAAPLLLFYVERRRVRPLLYGMAACGAAYAVLLWAIGDPLSIATLKKIAGYANGAPGYLGFPNAFDLHPNRLLTLAPILVLFPFYWTGRIAREDAVVLGYAWILGTSVMCAQYLMWIIPFLLLAGRERFAAIYSLLAGVYLVTFYASSGHSAENIRNLGAYAPLRPLSWLTPDATDSLARIYTLLIVGDFLIPIACLVWCGVRQRSCRCSLREPQLALRQSRAATGVAALHRSHASSPSKPLLAAVALCILLITTALVLRAPTAPAYAAALTEKSHAYNLAPYPHENFLVIPDAAGLPSDGGLDVTHIGYACVLAWSCAAFMKREAAA
jgi:hypothetical protein